MTIRIGLVAQPKRRRGDICRAREQFAPSAMFRRARDHCDRAHGEWYVVTTSHGLVAPHQVIGPDAPVLHALTADARSDWAKQVARQLRERAMRSGLPIIFVLYASQEFSDLIVRAAPDLDFELPLAGRSLRDRVRWYDERLRIHARVLAPQNGLLVTA